MLLPAARPWTARPRAPGPPRALPATDLLRQAIHLPAMPFLTSEEAWALALTTFAGLSTCIGAGFAVSGVNTLRV